MYLDASNALNRIKKKYAGKVFRYKDILNLGVKKSLFYFMVKIGEIERVSHGLYKLEEDIFASLEDQFKIASIQHRTKSAICLQSALVYYNFTSRNLEKHTLLVDSSFDSVLGKVQLLRKRNPMWNVGIVKKDGFLITSIERTIIESAVYKSHTGYEGVQAIKIALKNKMVKLKDLYDISKKLGYEKKVKYYLEAHI